MAAFCGLIFWKSTSKSCCFLCKVVQVKAVWKESSRQRSLRHKLLSSGYYGALKWEDSGKEDSGGMTEGWNIRNTVAAWALWLTPLTEPPRDWWIRDGTKPLSSSSGRTTLIFKVRWWVGDSINETFAFHVLCRICMIVMQMWLGFLSCFDSVCVKYTSWNEHWLVFTYWPTASCFMKQLLVQSFYTMNVVLFLFYF